MKRILRSLAAAGVLVFGLAGVANAGTAAGALAPAAQATPGKANVVLADWPDGIAPDSAIWFDRGPGYDRGPAYVRDRWDRDRRWDRGWDRDRNWHHRRHWDRWDRYPPRYHHRRYYGPPSGIYFEFNSGPRYVAPRRAYRPAPAYAPRGHVEWCHSRYRSYRAYDNTYQPYNGPRRQCYSPYT